MITAAMVIFLLIRISFIEGRPEYRKHSELLHVLYVSVVNGLSLCPGCDADIYFLVDDTAVSPYHRIMRTTVTIDDDIYEAAVANAKATGRRLGEVLSEMARTALEPRQPSAARKRRTRFAVFEVPKGTRMISMSKVQKVLDDEGIV